MATASNIQWCEPCSRDGENQPADSWCSDCHEPLCVECARFHRKGKTTANHKTIPILEAKKLDSSILDISESCHIHDDQTLSFFCVQHDQICCAFCLRESHNKCKEVQSIDKASKGVKEGTAIEKLHRRISDFSIMICKILDVYKNNLSSISDQRDEYKEKIRNVRKELNTYLDELEQEMDTKFDACNKECKAEIEKNIKGLTARKHKSESRQTAIETLTEHASETRIFAAIKTIDLLQIEEEQFLSKFQEGLMAYILRLPSFDLIEKIKPILTRLSEIKIDRIKTTVQHPLNVQQVHAYKVKQGKTQLLYKIRCSQLEMEEMTRACFTMDDRIVFKGLPFRVYDITSSSVHTIDTIYMASNLTYGLNNNMYASFPSVGVYNIDIKNLNEGHRINKTRVKPGEYGLVKINNNMLYSNIKNGIVVFTEGGDVVKTLNCTLTARYMCLEKRGEILLSDGKSIIHMTESAGSHNEIPTNMKTDDEITGLDVDKQGQLYACICNKENAVIVRIKTATGYKEPVLENLVTPRDIAFHPTKNMFLVMTDHGKECSVYEVTN